MLFEVSTLIAVASIFKTTSFNQSCAEATNMNSLSKGEVATHVDVRANGRILYLGIHMAYGLVGY